VEDSSANVAFWCAATGSSIMDHGTNSISRPRAQIPFIAPPEMEPEVAEILSAPPDPERPYVYRGTRCHINKFGILNPAALEKVVRCTTRLRAEAFKAHPIAGDFDLAHLQSIHRYLFQDVYDWAGELRLIDFGRSEEFFSKAEGAAVEAARLPSDLSPPLPFVKAADIAGACRRLFEELARNGYLRGLDRPTFIEHGAQFLSDLYHIHPFRDGNGRTCRMFTRELAAAAGWELDMDWIPHARRHVSAYRAHCGDPSAFIDHFDQSLGKCERHEDFK
jgi:cell filamentation protein